MDMYILRICNVHCRKTLASRIPRVLQVTVTNDFFFYFNVAYVFLNYCCDGKPIYVATLTFNRNLC